MTARTHDMFAFATLVTTAVLFPPASLSVSTLMTSLVGNIVGALAPDMDQASNRLWDLLPGSDFTSRIFRRIFIGHRTISHSLLGMYLFYKLLLFVLPKIFNANYVDVPVLILAIMLGFASHLFSDALTKEGIPLFFPLPMKVGIPPLKFLRVTTDSWVEHILVLPAVLGYIGWFFMSHQDGFFSLLALLKQ